MKFKVLLITHYLIREILVDTVLDVHVRGVKIKKFLNPDVVTTHLLQKKRFIKRYLCWFAHRKPYVPCETMIERIIGSTSSSSNVYEVVDNNNNPYKNMVMNAMRMNQGYVSQCLIIDEELNVDVTKVFDILKDSDKPLWASTQITLNYRSLHKYSPSS
jgi:hypothetical protein